MGKEERRQTGSKEEKKHLSSLHKQEVPPSCSGLVKPLWLPQPLPYAAIWAHCFDNLQKKACIQKKQAKSCACASHNFSCVLHHVHLFLPPLHGMIPLYHQALGTGDSHVKWPPRRTERGHNNAMIYSTVCWLGCGSDLLPAQQPRTTFGHTDPSWYHIRGDMKIWLSKFKKPKEML